MKQITKKRWARADKSWPSPHTTPKILQLLQEAQAQNQEEGRLLLDVVVGERAAVLELLARENKSWT